MRKECYGYIYIIKNKINGKIYVGATRRGFEKRYPYGIKGTKNEFLKEEIKEFGADNFITIKEFYRASSNEDLFEKERFYIRKFESYKRDKGYNKQYEKYSNFFNKKGELNALSKYVVVEFEDGTRKEFGGCRECAEHFGVSHKTISIWARDKEITKKQKELKIKKIYYINKNKDYLFKTRNQSLNTSLKKIYIIEYFDGTIEKFPNQEECGKSIGVSRHTISKYIKNNKSMYDKNVKRIYKKSI